MLADTQTLSKDCPTDVDTNTLAFVRRYGDSDKSVFSVAGLTPPVETKLSISHEASKDGTQRKMARTDLTVVDSFGVAATGSCHIVWTRPPNTAITNALMLEATNRLIDFCIEGGANGNVTAILNGEV
jgi:hypothetical protein